MFRQVLRTLLICLVLVSVVGACGPAATPTATPAPPPPAGATPVPTKAPVPTAVPPTAVPPTAVPAKEKVVVFATTLAEPTLDPAFMAYRAGYGISQAVYEGLVALDQKGAYVPSLATSWTTSADGKTWTFKLRQGVKFHDGAPFTSAAVKYSWERLLAPETAAKDVTRLKPILDTMATPDDFTFQITTKGAYPEFFLSLVDKALGIVSPNAKNFTAAEYGRKSAAGTGPFKLDKWVGSDRMELVANKDYWGTKAQVDRLVFRSIPEIASIVAGLESGEIDAATELTGDDTVRLKSNAKLKVQYFDSSATFMICMLVTVKPLDDVRVRQAINYAVDKESIVKNIMRGLAQPTASPAFPGLPYRVVQPPYTYNPAKAKELLTQAGLAGGFTTKLAYNTSFEKGKEVIQAVQGYLKDVGINAEIEVFESAAYSTYFRDKTPEATRRLFMVSKSGAGVDFNLTRLYSKATWDDDNRERYFNQTVEDLLASTRYSFDEALRAKNYAEIQRIIWQDAPEIWMYNPLSSLVSQTTIGGLWVRPVDDAPQFAAITKQ